MENHHAINGQINYKWQYPIALLNYQRVILNDWESKMLLKAMLVPAGNQTSRQQNKHSRFFGRGPSFHLHLELPANTVISLARFFFFASLEPKKMLCDE